MTGRRWTSAAKAVYRKSLFAALKRRATQKLHAVVESHLSQRTRKMGHPAFLMVFIATLCIAQAPVPTGAPSPKPNGGSGKADVKPRADAIYFHANIYTGVASNSPFGSTLREEAIAVRGDRIQAVGKNLDIMKLKGPDTEVVDLGGRFVMPGFNDAHVHLAEGGLQKLTIDLTGVKTLEELRERVKARVEKAKPDEWI
ncbi:MAG: amidohydrolase family protein, partial [Candidatus Sulfotelmatobacter sp.]